MRVATLFTLMSVAAIGLAACAPESAAPSNVTAVDVPPLSIQDCQLSPA